MNNREKSLVVFGYGYYCLKTTTKKKKMVKNKITKNQDFCSPFGGLHIE